MTAHGVPVDCLQSLAWDPALLLTTALRKVGNERDGGAVARVSREHARRRRGERHYDFRRVPQRGLDDRAVVNIRWNEANSTWVARQQSRRRRRSSFPRSSRT